MPRTRQEIATLEEQVAQLRERLASVEVALKEAQAAADTDPAAAPARSVRRATQRRASRRRAEARTRQLDIKAGILEFLSKHPGSTAGEVAKGLDLERANVSSLLTQLAKLGKIRKVERGYAAD